jgi:hypothetical protein
MANATARHEGWSGDGQHVRDMRRPLVRRAATMLRVDGAPAIAGAPSELRLRAGIDTSGYYTYPLLFYAAFPDVSLAELRALSLCGSYLFDYVLSIDKLLDQQTGCDGGGLLLAGLLQGEALAILHGLFPAHSTFWTYYEAYYGHFARAVLGERARHHCLVRPYSGEELGFIYSGKPAMAKACIAALALLQGDERPIESLARSHDAFYVAFQLLDDAQDWRIDYCRRHFTYLLTRAFAAAGWERRVESDRPPAPFEVGELLERSGVVDESLATALRYLDQAEATLELGPPGSWAAAIEQTRARIKGFRFRALELPQMNACPEPSAGSSERAAAVAAPISRSWLTWLDHRRPPAIRAAAILAEQDRLLRGASVGRTLGQAACQVGLAIHRSLDALPQHDLAAHLGLSDGELGWCRRNEAWLRALLALSADEPVRQWAPADASTHSSLGGWAPVGAVRYLGHRLVADYAVAHSGVDGASADAVLAHYRAHMVA